MKASGQDIILVSCAIVILSLSVLLLGIDCQSGDHQPRLWTATLAQEHHKSGLPWKAEIREPTYEAARRTAAERLHWHDKTFMVAPITENYVDVGQMSITP